MARQTSMSVDGYLAWQILKDWRHDLNARIGGRFYNTYYRYTMGQGYNTGNDYMTALSNTNSDLRTLTGQNIRTGTRLGILMRIMLTGTVTFSM